MRVDARVTQAYAHREIRKGVVDEIVRANPAADGLFIESYTRVCAKGNRCRIDRTGTRQVSYRCHMARNADTLPVEPVIDLVDDGLSESEIATRFAEWLSDLEVVPVVVLPVSAIDELCTAYADDDV